MKKYLILLAAPLLLSGCSETKRMECIAYDSAKQLSSGKYDVRFKNDNGDIIRFWTNVKKDFRNLQQGELYSVDYYYKDMVEYDYTINYVEICNKPVQNNN